MAPVIPLAPHTARTAVAAPSSETVAEVSWARQPRRGPSLFITGRCPRDPAGRPIDHIAIAPGGVWVVIDARRRFGGEAHVVLAGAHPGELRIGDSNRTGLVVDLTHQVQAVTAVVEAICPDVRTDGSSPLPPRHRSARLPDPDRTRLSPLLDAGDRQAPQCRRSRRRGLGHAPGRGAGGGVSGGLTEAWRRVLTRRDHPVGRTRPAFHNSHLVSRAPRAAALAALPMGLGAVVSRRSARSTRISAA